MMFPNFRLHFYSPGDPLCTLFCPKSYGYAKGKAPWMLRSHFWCDFYRLSLSGASGHHFLVYLDPSRHHFKHILGAFVGNISDQLGTLWVTCFTTCAPYFQRLRNVFPELVAKHVLQHTWSIFHVFAKCFKHVLWIQGVGGVREAFTIWRSAPSA